MTKYVEIVIRNREREHRHRGDFGRQHQRTPAYVTEALSFPQRAYYLPAWSPSAQSILNCVQKANGFDAREVHKETGHINPRLVGGGGGRARILKYIRH